MPDAELLGYNAGPLGRGGAIKKGIAGLNKLLVKMLGETSGSAAGDSSNVEPSHKAEDGSALRADTG